MNCVIYGPWRSKHDARKMTRRDSRPRPTILRTDRRQSPIRERRAPNHRSHPHPKPIHRSLRPDVMETKFHVKQPAEKMTE